MRLQFIDAAKKAYSLSLLCKVMKVSRSGFYSWKTRVILQKFYRRFFASASNKLVSVGKGRHTRTWTLDRNRWYPDDRMVLAREIIRLACQFEKNSYVPLLFMRIFNLLL